jgi:hypothetical protein
MRWSATLLIASLLAVGSVGCRSCQRVEEELRAREDQLREARQDIACLKAANFALQNEIRMQRGEPLAPDGSPPPALTYPVHELTLGRQTGGYEPDGKGGDIGLQVVLEPRDRDKSVIKAPGTAEVEVYELPREGPRHLLSRWTISSEQLRTTWRSSLLSTGYFVILPWQTPPTTTKLYLIARFITPDNHVFEAGSGKEITVKLLSSGVRPPPTPVQAPEPPPGPILPAPTPDAQSGRNQPGGTTGNPRWWLVPEKPTTISAEPPSTSTPTSSGYTPHPPMADTRPQYLPTEPEPPKPPVRPVGAWDPG